MKRQRDRFRELKDQVPKTKSEKKKGLRRADRMDKLEKFAQFLEPQKKEELSAAKLNMLRAGYTGKNAVRMFHAIQFLLAILFLVGGLIVALVKSMSQEMSGMDLMLHSLLPCAIGYYIPRYWVNKRVEQRQTEIIQGFPDALDLMLVCVEAGQSLDQSIIRSAAKAGRAIPRWPMNSTSSRKR
jgi:tight adherence protein C